MFTKPNKLSDEALSKFCRLKPNLDNMPEDHEVQREIWESKIPIQFVLAADEIAAEEQPKLYCVRQTFAIFTFGVV